MISPSPRTSLALTPDENHPERLLRVLEHEPVGGLRLLERDAVRDQRLDHYPPRGHVLGELAIELVVPAARERDRWTLDVGRVEVDIDRVGVVALHRDPPLRMDKG